MHLLETVGVACVPGQEFFTGPEGHGVVRFCFAKEDEVIDDACRRLEQLR
jgi:aminotransferase